MRLLTPLLVLLLISSLVFNGIMAMKIKGKRAIFSVNGQGVSRKDMDDYLENKEGPTVKATMVRRMLIEQEAKKKNMLPTDAEVEQAFNDRKEAEWQYAFNVNRNPWLATEAKNDLRTNIAATRLTLNEIPVQDSEIQEAYKAAAPAFDTPDKAYGNLAIITDPNGTDQTTQQVITNLSKDPPVSPAAIESQYPGKVRFIGNEYTYMFQRPFEYKGNYASKPVNDIIFKLKEKEVKRLPLTRDIAQIGGRAVVFKALRFVSGKKADLNDPKTKERLKQYVAAKRAKPFEEIMNGIWTKADFQSDNPEDKNYIASLLFPNRPK